MKDFIFTVVYNATVTEKTLVNADTKEDAIKARKQAEIKYFGEFRNKLND